MIPATITPDQFLKLLNEKPTHSTKFIKECLASLSTDITSAGESVSIKDNSPITYQTFKIDKLKKFDVVKMPTFGTIHYILIHKIVGDIVYGLPLTSKEKHFCVTLIEGERRFNGRYITGTYLSFPLEDCKKNFVSSFENKRLASESFKCAKELYRKLLR